MDREEEQELRMKQMDVLKDFLTSNPAILVPHNDILDIVGVDTRQEIYELIKDLRRSGLAIRTVYGDGYIYVGQKG